MFEDYGDSVFPLEFLCFLSNEVCHEFIMFMWILFASLHWNWECGHI